MEGVPGNMPGWSLREGPKVRTAHGAQGCFLKGLRKTAEANCWYPQGVWVHRPRSQRSLLGAEAAVRHSPPCPTCPAPHLGEGSGGGERFMAEVMLDESPLLCRTSQSWKG